MRAAAGVDLLEKTAARFTRKLRSADERLGKLARLNGYHLCYDDFGHHHMVEPDDLAHCIRMANLGVSRSPCRADWIHMPVPINRRDDAFLLR